MTEVPIMVMPWHRPDPCKPSKMQTEAAFKSSYLDYLGTLNLDSPPQQVTLSGIMCTIGSASNNVDTMTELMMAGMTMALVPLAMGQRQDHIDTIANVRIANTAYNQARKIVLPLAIAVQMKGPGLRIGGLYKDVPVQLSINNKITLTTEKSWRLRGTENFLYVNFPDMAHVLTEADLLLIGNGIVILQVESLDKTEAVCQIVGGGLLTSFMTLCVPDVPLHLPPLSEDDKDDLKLAASMGVDIVVATHTQSYDHLREVRRVLCEEDNGSGIKVWAQIESKHALNNLDSIIEEADAVLLSRITLTNDIPPEKLFLAQKKVISACNKAGTPVYLSSHYLPSMQVDIDPPITEVFDVANAILDGADGFVLRNTTAIGKHPERTVRTLVKLCREAEAAVWQYQTFSFLTSHLPPPIDPTHAVAISAVEASLKSSAVAILLATTSGRSAQVVARFRPRCPIIAITRYGQVARQLNAWRGVIPLHYLDPPLPEWTREVDVRIQFGIEYGKERGIIAPGDVLVLMNGWRQGAGFTNTLRLVYASESFPWVYPHKIPRDVPPDVSIGRSESQPSGEASTSIHSQRRTFGDGRISQGTQGSHKPSIVSKQFSRSSSYLVETHSKDIKRGSSIKETSSVQKPTSSERVSGADIKSLIDSQNVEQREESIGLENEQRNTSELQSRQNSVISQSMKSKEESKSIKSNGENSELHDETSKKSAGIME